MGGGDGCGDGGARETRFGCYGESRSRGDAEIGSRASTGKTWRAWRGTRDLGWADWVPGWVGGRWAKAGCRQRGSLECPPLHHGLEEAAAGMCWVAAPVAG